MSTPLEKELAETKAQLTLSNTSNADLQDAIAFAETERDVALELRHDAFDMVAEEHAARLAVEAKLAIALRELATLRATHAAVLEELDDLRTAVAGHFLIH
jgi:hypothetical protein